MSDRLIDDPDVVTATVDFADPPRVVNTPSRDDGDETRVLEPGERVGKFVVVRVVGAGGMGMVYEARDEVLNRRVALKMLRPGVGSRPRSVTDLVEEARAAATLAHPNVVTVHEAGVDDAGPFIAMEYIDGLTLRRWLEAGERNWREVVHIFRQVADGLAAAHAAGLVHCDVKPDNILIAGDRAWIADFGIARAMGGKDTEPAAGTINYMAPEQRKGVVDERTDQYGFAVSLFEALTGQLPSGGASMQGKVPGRLQRAVLRARERDPSLRFPNMTALARALTPTRRGPTYAGVAVLALLGVVLVLAARHGASTNTCARAVAAIDGAWNNDHAEAIAKSFQRSKRSYAGWYAQRIAQSLNSYRASWSDARKRACRDREDVLATCLDRRVGMISQLVGELKVGGDDTVDRAIDRVGAATGPACGIGTAPVEPTKDTAAALAQRKRELGEGNPLLHSFYTDHAARLVADGQPEQALAPMRVGVKLMRMDPNSSASLPGQLNALAMLELQEGDHDAAARLFSELTKGRETEPSAAPAWAGLGDALVQSGAMRDGKLACERALSLQPTVASEASVRALRCLGVVEQKLGRGAVAAMHFGRALKYARALKHSAEDVTRLQIDLALAFDNSKRTDEAEKQLRAAKKLASPRQLEHIRYYLWRMGRGPKPTP